MGGTSSNASGPSTASVQGAHVGGQTVIGSNPLRGIENVPLSKPTQPRETKYVHPKSREMTAISGDQKPCIEDPKFGLPLNALGTPSDDDDSTRSDIGDLVEFSVDS
eukprot:CAMPEP_0117561204 /NCGR_PEP_ID=MMETSP0784-20121206/54284_1 /TAXON_ID=39447 /ORGANISM="" /LENGTH=106 /DNA_ID=CAMNT_0005358663 /DNA_START=45 /DNA_END=362 /DNA_ORIENTATION=-